LAILQDYTFVVKHVSGESNAMADALSRWEQEQEVKNELAMMFREGVMVMSIEMAEEKGWVIAWFHENPLTGHPGVNKTLEKIRREGIDWKGLMDNVALYVKGCLACQRSKPQKGPTLGEMAPLPVPNTPWKEMAWDLVGPLQESGRYNAIAVCTDINSKEARFQAMTTEVAGLGVTRILQDRVVHDRGLLEKIYSDQGPQFVSAFMKELYGMLSVEANPSLAYQPQMDR
jgi:hypothetical protein